MTSAAAHTDGPHTTFFTRHVLDRKEPPQRARDDRRPYDRLRRVPDVVDERRRETGTSAGDAEGGAPAAYRTSKHMLAIRDGLQPARRDGLSQVMSS